MTAGMGADFRRRAVDQRIFVELVPGHQVIIAGGRGDGLGISGRVEQKRRAAIIHGTTAPTAILIIETVFRGEGDGTIAPMDQIIADRMSPMNRAVEGPIGIVLVKKMVLALPFDQPVRIIHPVGGGDKMDARPVGVGAHLLA